MITAEETRQRLRLSGEQARKRAWAKPPWHPLEPADLQPETKVLAFDASLSNVGWAVIWAEPDMVHVSQAGTLRPLEPDDGYIGTWRRASELRHQLLNSEQFVWHRRARTKTVVEAPPVGGGLHRTESSLIAGMMVWQVFDDVQPVSATHVSSVLLNEPKILSDDRKKRVRAEVIRLIPGAAGRNWNEHMRDAVSVALVTLRDMREAA
jgi:hypothetical protein